jgi:hypothetical protein
MMEFRDIDFEPRVYRRNFLLQGLPDGAGEGGFDVIATNPPWGMHFSRTELERLASLYPEIRSQESFSYVLKKSIDLLRDGGSLSFILPESILNVKTHGDIRAYILEKTRMRSIVRLGRVFKNVYSPVIRLDLAAGAGRSRLRYVSGRSVSTIDQGRFVRNSFCAFDVNIGGGDGRVIERIYGQEHVTLRGNAAWALGIVTGNNGKFLHDGMPGRDFEPVYTGKDVRPYLLGEPSHFIRFAPEKFQQSAPERLYRAPEKLVYRFISKNLVFAYDDRGCLTLNSANILIPRVPGYPARTVLALFNSTLYQFLFQKKFSSIKVLRGHLEQLPLPLWSETVLRDLASLADKVLAGEAGPEEADEFIMDRFALTVPMRRHILRSIS